MNVTPVLPDCKWDKINLYKSSTSYKLLILVFQVSGLKQPLQALEQPWVQTTHLDPGPFTFESFGDVDGFVLSSWCYLKNIKI